MSDVVAYSAISSPLIPPQASPAPQPAPVSMRAPRGDALRCTTCSMRSICMPQGLSAEELRRIESLICPSRTIRQGETIFRANDSFQSIYAVRAGSFKTVVMHRDGREQVTGFHLAGDSMGLDGVCSGRHGCDAIALEDSKVCIIPFHLLEAMCREVKAVQQHLHRMMGGEIVRESSQMMLLGTMSAEQRVATFLLNLSDRLKLRGYSPAEFHLRMTREEIGSYLGIKLETVSRMLSKFQRDGLVDTRGKDIRILDREGLARV
ncbi:fumarate/nitrate reduction transcriptional regulator Fnr [Paraburkholderia fungorum]|uniref:fumarate/nitrate reduction transcriptional regulator Fnr n=1 Tax=Paraburkholderia fungorum TaxID=134537 RepID=UPI002092CCDF|nr:fumarate/nitrate reduction transcriptional regulator Fnr [Paraburkholderia fungorum]USU18196.1 fumarate/nitrate reduction transcriptional regulator Fnr [Paraburkholderia fungorum]USU26140.1 fumarate/nitrate reduction transcriptional regulator Fnr [Paraburkholderia fungorum]